MNKKYIIYILSLLLLIIISVISYYLILNSKIDFEDVDNGPFKEEDFFEEESVVEERKAILGEISKEQESLTEKEIENNLRILQKLNP